MLLKCRVLFTDVVLMKSTFTDVVLM